MTIIEVADDATLQKQFLLLPVKLYAEDDNWIRPLDQDIENTFNPKKNKYFKHGEAIRWILQDSERQTIGRVAAFINHETANKEDQPTGGMGFFECIEDEKAAFLLFETCKNWLSLKGMEAMDGPINFGERDSFWGLMIKGWQYEPTYKMPWTKPYYIPFFENYGFKDYFQQYVYVTPIKAATVADTVEDKARKVYANEAYDFRHIEKSKLAKYGEDFRTIFNEAWAKFPGVKEMTKDQAQSLVNTMKPIIDEQLTWFAYAGERPIAFFIVIPDLNQIVKYMNGKFGTWQKLKFALLLMRGVITRTCGVIFGVVPDFQGKGIESAIALRFRQAGRDNPHYQYETIDMNWVGDFNPKMNRFVTQLGTTRDKEYVTYRYLFDRTKAFKRCPRVG
jgi:GNAT superfamily N-acetyltransferase